MPTEFSSRLVLNAVRWVKTATWFGRLGMKKKVKLWCICVLKWNDILYSELSILIGFCGFFLHLRLEYGTGAHAYIDVHMFRGQTKPGLLLCYSALPDSQQTPVILTLQPWAVLYMCIRAFPCVLGSNADPHLTHRATSSLCCFFL